MRFDFNFLAFQIVQSMSVTETPLEKFCTVLMAYEKSTPPNEVRFSALEAFCRTNHVICCCFLLWRLPAPTG